MKGLFLVLEGGDGSGKSSQLELLAEFLKKSGRKVQTLHFPRLREKPYGELIAGYLRGDFGPLDRVDPQLSALLYALDRMEAAGEMRELLASGHTLLADRYILSNLAYQCARTPDPEKKRRLALWIESFEYGHNAIPRPDLTLYLDDPLSFAMKKLAGDRAGADREYLEGKRDLHEADGSLQERVRKEFLELARQRVGEIGVVDCRNEQGGMADRTAIHHRVIDALRYYGIVSR